MGQKEEHPSKEQMDPKDKVKLEHVSTISSDFMEVVCMIISKSLIKGCNVTTLCSRRNIELIKDVPNMKSSKSKQRFDANLSRVGQWLSVSLSSGMAGKKKTLGITDDIPTDLQKVHGSQKRSKGVGGS